MAKEPIHRRTFIRQWREHRGYSLDRLAGMVPMDKSNLSKVERGILPYNQEMLERLAESLMTDPASLLMRDPTNQDAIWTIWANANPGERQQIEAVARALIQGRLTA
jgi:transcriptional regulator with XRE-family HTH domain